MTPDKRIRDAQWLLVRLGLEPNAGHTNTINSFLREKASETATATEQRIYAAIGRKVVAHGATFHFNADEFEEREEARREIRKKATS